MARRTKSPEQKLVERARKGMTTQEMDAWRAAWLRVYRAVKAAGGGLAESDRARVAMLQANVDGRSIEEGVTLALAAVIPPCPV